MTTSTAAVQTDRETILQLEGLTKHFPVKRGVRQKTTGAVRAVDGIDLTVRTGETLGLVGESGCGKTTLSRLIIKLVEANTGRIVFDGEDITNYSRRQMSAVRERLQIVFQDPYASLNPQMTVRQIVSEPLRIHGRYDRRTARRQVDELLSTVGLSQEQASRLPHEFSGGRGSGSGSRGHLSFSHD